MSPREAGACFQTRVGTPRIVVASISNRAPGAVRIAWTSSKEGTAGSVTGGAPATEPVRCGASRGAGEELGHAGFDAAAQHVDVGGGVVVTGEAEVDLPVVREDRHRDSALRAERDVRKRGEHAAAQHIERELGAGHVRGDGADVALAGFRG